MNQSQWQQVKKLFHAALALPEGERDAYLRQVCAGDDELLREVAALLESAEATGEFMQRPVMADARFDSLLKEEEDLPQGQNIGPYIIEHKIGEGGMGQVYRAYDSRLGRAVAIKVLRTSLTRDVERVRRFQQEARAVSALNHPNILTIYEVDSADGLDFIATELIKGQTLRAIMKAGGLTMGEVLEIVMQVGKALAAAHEAGIIHRDIKPENLMQRADGYVKVLDFGLAKLTEPQDHVSFLGNAFSHFTTRPGVVMGTVTYMSPEQARGLDTDRRTDIFSLGIVLYEMLTGKLPFRGETNTDVLVAILEHEPLPLKEHNPALPSALQRIVSRALAKDRDQRYQQVTDLLNDLKVLKQELELAAHLKRSGDSSKRQISLNLRLAQPATNAAADTDGKPTKITAPLTAATFLQRVAGHGRYVLVGALILLAMVVSFYYFRLRTSGSAIHSIAVMPFAGAGNNRQVEYLLDGLTEGLINNLAQLPGLHVMARSTVFTYKGRDVTPREIGNALQVSAVVMGEAVQRDKDLIIRVELIDASDGTRLWGDQYKTFAGDAFGTQREITREIARQLRLTLSSNDQKRLTRHTTENPEAYQLYFQGLYYWNQRTPEALQKSVEYYRQAIAQDPNFALAHAGLAAAYAILPAYTAMPPREASAAAKASAATAITLDPQLSEAHAARGFVYYSWDWDYARAEQEFQRALTLNPNDATAHRWYSLSLSARGHLPEALKEAHRARELDPLTHASYANLFRIYSYLGQPEEALQQIKRASQVNPTMHGGMYTYLGLAYFHLARYEEAIAEFQRALTLGEENEAPVYIGEVHARAGRRAEAQRVLKTFEPRALQGLKSCVQIAEVYVALGQYDQAFAWLERALERREEPIVWLKVNPRLAALRTDPRYAALLKQLGLDA